MLKSIIVVLLGRKKVKVTLEEPPKKTEAPVCTKQKQDDFPPDYYVKDWKKHRSWGNDGFNSW